MLYFLCCIKTTSISATASSDICLEYFWSDSKEEGFCLGWSSRTDSLPCYLPEIILKISVSKIVELSADFLVDFDNF